MTVDPEMDSSPINVISQTQGKCSYKTNSEFSFEYTVKEWII